LVVAIRHPDGALDTGILSELSAHGVWGTASTELVPGELYLLRLALWEDAQCISLRIVVRSSTRSRFHALLLRSTPQDSEAFGRWLCEKRSEHERLITVDLGPSALAPLSRSRISIDSHKSAPLRRG
jgi:hypothetical protein